MTKKLITITGELGSGKSSVCRKLAEHLGWERYATGDVQRKLAKARGMTTLEFNLLAEKDPSIDRQIDGVFANLQVTGENLIVDSRMAWFFLPNALKIRLIVSLTEAARRVHQDASRVSEDNKSVHETFESLRERGKSEKRRFKRYYGVEIEKDKNFDFVISTDMVSVDDVVGLIACLKEVADEASVLPKYWATPSDLFPTKKMYDIEGGALEDLRDKIKSDGFSPLASIKVVARKHDFFIVDGHKRVSAALAAKAAFVPLDIVQEGDPLLEGQTIESFLKEKTSLTSNAMWEVAHGITFNRDPLVSFKQEL